MYRDWACTHNGRPGWCFDCRMAVTHRVEVRLPSDWPVPECSGHGLMEPI